MNLAHALPLASALSALHWLRKDAAPPAPAATSGNLTFGDLAAGRLKAPGQAPQTPPAGPLKVVEYQGIPVHVDRPAGTIQKGVGSDGAEWVRCYHVDYGHVPGTRGGDDHRPEFGKDGQLDVYLGLMPDAPEAHWVLQTKDDGTFDEYKMMLGCTSAESAKALWNAHTPKRYFGGMTSTSVEMVKSLLGMRPAEAMKVLKALTGAEAAAQMLAVAAAVEKMIREQADGWHVYSEDGAKHLGGPYATKADAVERLRQVEGHKAKALASGDARHEVTFTGSDDAAGSVERVLRVMQYMGEVGHSGELFYEDDGLRSMGGFDGDGPSKVQNLTIDGRTPATREPPLPTAYAKPLTPEQQARYTKKAAGTIVLAELRKGEGGEEIRYVLAPVLVPDVVDAQGDTYSADEVRKAEWLYMKRYRNVGVMHKQLVNGRVDLVESYCAPVDMLVEGSRIAKGTRMMGLHVSDDALWDDVKSGRLNGLSIGGVATKTPV